MECTENVKRHHFLKLPLNLKTRFEFAAIPESQDREFQLYNRTVNIEDSAEQLADTVSSLLQHPL